MLLDSWKLKRDERRLITLLDRTFKKGIRNTSVYPLLPMMVRREFSSATYQAQLDRIISDILVHSINYVDNLMKRLPAAGLGQSTILTEEAVRASTQFSVEAAESIVRMLEDEGIYYMHPVELSRHLVDLWDDELYRAIRFARTFTADVATATTLSRYRQYNVRYMEFSAELDDRTSEQCQMLHGTIFDLEKDDVDMYRPPLHHHCRSGLMPVPTDYYDEDRLFENRDFDDPDDVFERIDKFNENYRVSQYIVDQDILQRMMFEKGFSVGIDGVLPDVKILSESTIYDGITYKLTPSDLKKATVKAEDIPRKLEEWDAANKEKLGKKWGLKKRDYASSLQTLTPEYRLGLGQGRLDRLNGIEYLEKGDDKNFNRGYYTGWNDNPSSWLKDAKKNNPNFQKIK